LDAGKNSADLSPSCLGALDGLFEEVAVYNQYSWGSPCGADGSGNWGDGEGFTCGGDAALSAYLANSSVQVALNVIKPGAAALKWQVGAHSHESLVDARVSFCGNSRVCVLV
jgi:hypothetical protein